MVMEVLSAYPSVLLQSLEIYRPQGIGVTEKIRGIHET